MKEVKFITWSEFVTLLPISRATADRWFAAGRLKVKVMQPAGPGGRRYVSVHEVERVLQAFAEGKRP